MANQFRTIRCDMWRKDEWFADLAPDAKLVWIYAFTNESTSPAGIYRIALRTIANETGIAIERVREIVADFAASGKLYFEDGIIWPVTMRKHQTGELKASDNLVAKVRADVAEIGDSPIVDRYKAYYGPLPGRDKPLPTPSEAPSDPHRLTDTDTDTNTKNDDEDAGARREEAQPDPAAEAVAGAIRAFENQIGLLSGAHQSGEMTAIASELHARDLLVWWQSALNIACDNNARKWSYVRAILENSLKTGIAPGTKPPAVGRSNGHNGAAKPRVDPAVIAARRKVEAEYDNEAALARLGI